jgi:hypothetical protein
MSKKPATALTIQSVKRTRKRIFIAYHNGVEDLTISSTDNPLPDFHTALDKLPALMCVICAFPESYAEGLRPMGIKMGEQGEADTVSVLGQKSLSDAAKALNIVTPPRLLAHPTEPGTYTPPLTEEQAEGVWALIEAAKDYVKGKRAQGVLPGFDGEEDEEEHGGGEGEGKENPAQEKLPGVVEEFPAGGEAPIDKKKKKAKKKKK